MNHIKEFIPSTFDPVFKAILTDEKLRDYLSYLISEITDLDYEELYNNIKIENSELMIKVANEKAYRTDLIVSVNENVINIEANSNHSIGQDIKNNRYHHSIASNMKRSDDYISKYVYQINFNEFNHFKSQNRVLDKVMLMNIDTGEIDEEEFQRYYINLEKLRKKYYNNNELSLFEKRCLILGLTKEEDIRKIIKGDDMLERVYDKMKELNENTSILDLWDSEREYQKAMEYDRRLAIEEATKQGHEEGMKRGIEQGIEQGIESQKLEIAKNMKKENIALEVIAKVTGLKVQEIEAID